MSAGSTRRAFLQEAGLASAALLAAPYGASARRSRRGARQTVAVLGGGIAGLTAAHELAERGFDVTVYERRAWGGKARSVDVTGTARDGRKPLPGEHGFRIVFGFYENLPDTMRRIPFGTNPNGVFDNLVGATEALYARAGKHDLAIPLSTTKAAPRTPEHIRDGILSLALESEIPPQAAAHFADRFAVYLSSCDERRHGQWENTPWSDFIGSERFGDDYRKIFALPFTQFFQASKTQRTSAQFAGHVFEAIVYGLLGRGVNGPVDRVLDAPTNEAWIDPWVAHLKRLGVRLRNRHAVRKLHLRGGRITGATIRARDRTYIAHADWYVCALPAERARRLWTSAILAVDPRLGRMGRLETAWMNGLQFYLREETPIANGHVVCLDSPWAVSCVSQAQFWDRSFTATYGDGRTRDCISAVISDWDTPGLLHGQAARTLKPEQIAREAWEQMKQHLNDTGHAELNDELLDSWHVDPGLRINGRGDLTSEDELVLPSVGSYANRPEASTKLPNLLLAGDYLRGPFEVANMEAASHNARTAVNELLERAGAPQPTCYLSNGYRPPEWEALKRIDADRYRRGEPNLFDADLAQKQLTDLLRREESNVLEISRAT